MTYKALATAKEKVEKGTNKEFTLDIESKLLNKENAIVKTILLNEDKQKLTIKIGYSDRYNNGILQRHIRTCIQKWTSNKDNTMDTSSGLGISTLCNTDTKTKNLNALIEFSKKINGVDILDLYYNDNLNENTLRNSIEKE